MPKRLCIGKFTIIEQESYTKNSSEDSYNLKVIYHLEEHPDPDLNYAKLRNFEIINPPAYFKNKSSRRFQRTLFQSNVALVSVSYSKFTVACLLLKKSVTYFCYAG